MVMELSAADEQRQLGGGGGAGASLASPGGQAAGGGAGRAPRCDEAASPASITKAPGRCFSTTIVFIC